MKYAIVKNNEVTNIVEWDGESDFAPDGELVEATEDTKIGGSWDGNVFTFVTPEPPPDTRTYDEKRRDRYNAELPMGDQFDAILKGFNQLRLDGQDLPADLDEVIGIWLGIKSAIPKE